MWIQTVSYTHLVDCQHSLQLLISPLHWVCSWPVDGRRPIFNAPCCLVLAAIDRKWIDSHCHLTLWITQWLTTLVLNMVRIRPFWLLELGKSPGWKGPWSLGLPSFLMMIWLSPSHTGASLLIAWLNTGTFGTRPDTAGNILPHGNPEEPSIYRLVGSISPDVQCCHGTSLGSWWCTTWEQLKQSVIESDVMNT